MDCEANRRALRSQAGQRENHAGDVVKVLDFELGIDFVSCTRPGIASTGRTASCAGLENDTKVRDGLIFT